MDKKLFLKIFKPLRLIAVLFSGAIISYIFFSLSSCGDYLNDDCDNIIEAPQEFLDYWYFPVGSWWAYQINDTIIDTLKCTEITKYHFDKDDETLGLERCVYYYTAYLTHSNKDIFPSKSDNITFASSYTGKWYLHSGSYANLWYLGYYFIYPFQLGDTIYYRKVGGKKMCTFVEDIENDTINYNIYLSAIRIINTWEGDKPTDLFEQMSICKDVGIIKINYFNGKKIELLNFFINK